MPSTALKNALIAMGHVTNNPIAGTSSPYVDPATQAATVGTSQQQTVPAATSLLQPTNAPEATPTIGVPPTQTDSTPSTSAPNGQFLQSLQKDQNGNFIFQNDTQRILAINSGQYDPNYTTPLQKALATSISNDRTATQNALIAHNQAANPLDGATTPQQILQAQLAGDRTGLIKKLILKNQPTPIAPASGLGDTSNLQPYIGHIAPNATGVQTLAPLDMNLVQDPDFAKQYAQDPQEGMRVYKALTGRNLNADHKESIDFVQKNKDFERTTAEYNIAHGSKQNPDGTWQIPNAKLPGESSSMGLSTASPRPEFRPATKFENDIMNRWYANYAPGGPPAQPKFGSLLTRNSQAVVQQSATDPALKAKLQAASIAKGDQLNPAEIFAIGNQHADILAAQEYSDHPAGAFLGGLYSPGPASTKGFKNVHDLIANIAGFKSGEAGDAGEPNALGKFFTDPLPKDDTTLSESNMDFSGNY